MTSAPSHPPPSSGNDLTPAASDAIRVAPLGATPSADAAERACLNCGAAATANYCPECGQRVADPDPTLREMAGEIASEVLHWDGKLWATLQVLFRRPGELTIAYVGGKRATYVAPLRLYLTASVLYFFIVAVAPDLSTPVVRYTESDTSSAPTRAGSGLVVTATRSRTDTAVPAGLGGRARRRLEQGVQRAARDPTQFGARMRDNMGTVVFLVLPAFAFAVGLAYRRRRRHFPQHMVFALHVHAVAFLLFALAALARFTRVQVFAATMGVITLAVVVAYIVVALRRVYGGTWAATVGKTIALGVVYFVFYVAGSLTLALYSLVTS